MVENDIKEKRIRINALMNRNPMMEFEIDTTFQLSDFSNTVFDSTLFYGSRSDLKAVDKEINLTWLKQETERKSLKPKFGVRYEHMFGFGGLPMQYSLMGMLKVPIAGSTKMNKANIESLKWKANALQSQKEMMCRPNIYVGRCVENQGLARNRRKGVAHEPATTSGDTNRGTGKTRHFLHRGVWLSRGPRRYAAGAIAGNKKLPFDRRLF
jgi:hypothetical protein